MCALFHSFAARLDKLFEKLIINQFAINGEDNYNDEKAKEVFDVNFPGRISLPSNRAFFDKKIDQFNRFYLSHTDSLSGDSELDDDLRHKILDAQMNFLMQSVNQLDRASSWHKGRAKKTNSSFSHQFIPVLALVLLFNDCNLPATGLSKNFDRNQTHTVTRVKHGTTTNVDMDVTQAFHHNVKYLLKYCEVMMSTKKFAHLFGFESVKSMTPTLKGNYYSSIKSALIGIAKFAGGVKLHGLSDTIGAKIGGDKTKFSYQLYLFQDLHKSLTYYESNMEKLNMLKVNGQTTRGGIGFESCFFVNPDARKQCRDHMSVLGWHPYEYVKKHSGFEYWAPPLVEHEGSDSSDENDGSDSDVDE